MKPDPFTRESRGWISAADDESKGDEFLTLVCVKCKTDKFVVGQADYQTILRCPECGWERVVHDG